MIYVRGLGNNEIYLLLSICLFILGIFLQYIIKVKFNSYAKTTLESGKSGAEIAQEMLDSFFIDDVKIKEVDGFLSDNYNPITKTLNLSSDVYHGRNISAAAVAAHECGHAVQHNRGYIFIHLRTLMMPMVAFSAKFLNIFIFIGFLMLNTNTLPLEIGICLFTVVTLFSIITLPIEFNASSRAIEWIKENNIVNDQEIKKAKKALTLAALTYVIATLSSITELLRLVGILNSRRDD